MCSRMKKRRRNITDFINTILADLRSGCATYHPSIKDIANWLNYSYEIVWSVIDSILSDDLKIRQLWDETTPARGRIKERNDYKRTINPRVEQIVDFATRSLNDYLHKRTDSLPIYEEIGRVVTPHVTRSRVEQILSSYLPPEAIKFWMLNRRGNWRNISRLLNYASLQAERFFIDSSYHPMAVEIMADLFNLDSETSIRAICKYLPVKQAGLWQLEFGRVPRSQTRYRIRWLTRTARMFQKGLIQRLPTQEEIGRKLGISQTSVSRITRQWLPKDLAALWAVRKNHPRG